MLVNGKILKFVILRTQQLIFVYISLYLFLSIQTFYVLVKAEHTWGYSQIMNMSI